MPPVTGPMSGSIDPDVLNRLNSPQAADVLRRGNIDEILRATGVSKSDLENYFKLQHANLNQVVQDHQIYSDFGAVPAPQWNEHFSQESGYGKFTPQDHEIFMESLGRVSGKAQAVSGSKAVNAKAQTVSPQIQANIDNLNKQIDNAISDIGDRALDAQLEMDYKEQSQKLRDEFNAILANANDPETIILAMTQYKSKEAGLIVAMEGKAIQRISQQQTKAAGDTYNLSTADTKYYAETQVASQKISALSTSMQQHMSLIQSAAQNVESALSFGQSAIGELNKTQDAIQRNQAVKS